MAIHLKTDSMLKIEFDSNRKKRKTKKRLFSCFLFCFFEEGKKRRSNFVLDIKKTNKTAKKKEKEFVSYL